MIATVLDRALRERRVCFRRRQARTELVTALMAAGRPPDAEDLDDLVELAEGAPERRTVQDTPELVERWLRDGSWRKRLRDDRAAREHRAQESAAMDMPEGEVAGRLVCRVLGDKVPIAVAARELFLDPEEAATMVREWGPRYGHPVENVETALRR